jgi:hypothetical protein
MDLQRLVNDLFFRLQTAVKVPHAKVNQSGFFAIPNLCHDNVDRFVRLNPSFKRVPGFLCTEAAGRRIMSFVHHSVVETPAGDMLDVTPVAAGVDLEELFRMPYPFLRHVGLEADYGRAVEHGCLLADVKTGKLVSNAQSQFDDFVFSGAPLNPTVCHGYKRIPD